MVKDLILERNGREEIVSIDGEVNISLAEQLYPNVSSTAFSTFLSSHGLSINGLLTTEQFIEMLLSTNKPLDTGPKIISSRIGSELHFNVVKGKLIVRERD